MVWPKFNKNPLMITCQIQPRTIPPIKFGIKKIVLKTFVPFIPFVSKSAKAKAKTFIEITVTTVKQTVNKSAEEKLLSIVNASI